MSNLLIESIEQSGYKITHRGVISKLTGRLMVGGIDKKGYKRLSIFINRKQTTVKEHRLIAEKFIPNPYNKPQVNHLNGNKIDNRPENLQWVTCQENITHAWQTGLNRLSNNTIQASRIKNSKPVLDTATGKTYLNSRIACIELGLNYNTVRGRLNGNKFNNTTLIYINGIT